MRVLTRIAALGVLAAASLSAPAEAQYYPPPPRPYYPPPVVVTPPRRFVRGGRCDAYLATAYGPRREICFLRFGKPIGAPCHCPPPRGYGGPPRPGRTIR